MTNTERIENGFEKLLRTVNEWRDNGTTDSMAFLVSGHNPIFEGNGHDIHLKVEQALKENGYNVSWEISEHHNPIAYQFNIIRKK